MKCIRACHPTTRYELPSNSPRAPQRRGSVLLIVLDAPAEETIITASLSAPIGRQIFSLTTSANGLPVTFSANHVSTKVLTVVYSLASPLGRRRGKPATYS